MSRDGADSGRSLKVLAGAVRAVPRAPLTAAVGGVSWLPMNANTARDQIEMFRPGEVAGAEAAAPAAGPATVEILGIETAAGSEIGVVISAGDGRHGRVRLRRDGSLDYQPDPGYLGADSFICRVADRRGRVSTATVSVLVRAPTPRAGRRKASPDEARDQASAGSPSTESLPRR